MVTNFNVIITLIYQFVCKISIGLYQKNFLKIIYKAMIEHHIGMYNSVWTIMSHLKAKNYINKALEIKSRNWAIVQMVMKCCFKLTSWCRRANKRFCHHKRCCMFIASSICFSFTDNNWPTTPWSTHDWLWRHCVK